MVHLKHYLQELATLPPELLIQPEIKQQRLQHDKTLREEQELEGGALLQAVVEPGRAGGESPREGNLVYVHVSISPLDASSKGAELPVKKEVLWSTRTEEGGSGQPLVFALEKGVRPPRAWEVALKSMTVGQRSIMRVRPSMGYLHPECQLQPPPGVQATQHLVFDLQLVQCYSDAEVRLCGSEASMFKTTLREGSSWESVRPPCEVTFHITLRALEYSGKRMKGHPFISTRTASGSLEKKEGPLTAQLGAGQLPSGIEDAVGQLCKDEYALFILPAAAVRSVGDINHPCSALARAVPSRMQQVEAEIELVSILQVRDITGTGEVLKRRLREGRGEFPVDCPMHDTSVRAHYRVRAVRGGVPTEWLFDTRSRQGHAHGQQGEGGGGQTQGDGAAEERMQDQGGGLQGEGQQGKGHEALCQPVEFDTGCGEAPLGLEMAIKLMLPGELALVSIRSASKNGQASTEQGRGTKGLSYGYSSCDVQPPGGIATDDDFDFEVELLDFDKEARWQVMPMEERFALVERVKSRANDQVRAGKHASAKGRYLRVLRLMDTTRDFETEEEIEAMDRLKVLILSNVALCCTSLGDYASAVTYASKGLELEGTNIKLLFRRGRALSLKGDYEEAEADFHAAAKADPSCAADMGKEVAANEQRAKAADRKQRSEMKNFLSRS